MGCYTLPVRRLIINADDFGLTAGVNQAVQDCHRAGLVTSTTLMANSNAFSDAVSIAKSLPSLRVGCHVVLIDGMPLLPARDVYSLLSHGINFRNSFSAFATAAMRGRLVPEQITAEAAEQMRKIQGEGLELTHFDAHKHAHMFPQVLRPLLQAAGECGVRALRNPFVPVKAVAYAHLVRRPKLWMRYSEVKTLRCFAAAFRSEVDAAGLRTTDGTFGIISTGALDQQLFNAIIGSIPEGTWEFVCHPGYNDPELARINTRLRQSREAERLVLTSPESRERIKAAGIELITYAEL